MLCLSVSREGPGQQRHTLAKKTPGKYVRTFGPANFLQANAATGVPE